MADHESIEKLARALVEELHASSKAVCTAESCSGGWIAKAITDIPGSSLVFHYGIVSYSNGAKESLLGVKLDTLERHGAVSEAVVIEMAKGAVRLSGADVGVAVSGVAGPDGGSKEKPVGTVWMAVAMSDMPCISRCYHFSGDRGQIQAASIGQAIGMLLEALIPGSNA